MVYIQTRWPRHCTLPTVGGYMVHHGACSLHGIGMGMRGELHEYRPCRVLASLAMVTALATWQSK